VNNNFENDIFVVEIHKSMLDTNQRTRLLEMIGEDHLFLTIEAAERFIEMSDCAEKANPNG
jgi:hypothetical protein